MEKTVAAILSVAILAGLVGCAQKEPHAFITGIRRSEPNGDWDVTAVVPVPRSEHLVVTRTERDGEGVIHLYVSTECRGKSGGAIPRRVTIEVGHPLTPGQSAKFILTWKHPVVEPRRWREEKAVVLKIPEKSSG